MYPAKLKEKFSFKKIKICMHTPDVFYESQVVTGVHSEIPAQLILT